MSEDWKAALPEDLRNDPSLASFKDVASLAKSYRETKSLVGASIRPPGPDAAPELKKAFVEKLLQIEPALVYAPDNDEESAKRLFRKLGRPEKPEEYDFEESTLTEAGLSINDLRALAVTAGLTKGQAKALAKVMVDANLEQKRSVALERLALDTEWGETKEERTLAAKAAALKMGLTEREVNALSPKQLKAFNNVAKAVGVASSEFRTHTAGPPRLDPAEARRQLAEARANPAYWDRSKNPAEHERLKMRVVELTKMAG